MMRIHLNTNRLASLVRNKRGSKNLREISQEIGNVSASTLSRIENCKMMPDMETFVALCNWLQVRPGDLFTTKERLDTAEEIAFLLLSDKNLDTAIAYALATLIRVAYRDLCK